MRSLFIAVLVVSAVSRASAAPALGVPETEVIAAPIFEPELDAVRLFSDTEVFRLDRGTERMEVRFSAGEPASMPALEVRGELGLGDHVQLNLAGDQALATGRTPPSESALIGVRYSLGAKEDEVPGNPAIELSFLPRSSGPARAELRLMASKAILPRLVVAVNGYLQQNADRSTLAGVDSSIGLTGGVSYALVPGLLRLGAEGKVGESQYGYPFDVAVIQGGPNAVLTRGPVALTVSLLADLTTRQIGLEPMSSLGFTF